MLECIENDVTFGIPTYIQDGVGLFGTEMKLLNIEKKHPNGEMDIRTQALGIFKILRFDRMAPGRLYAGGEVEMVKNKDDEDIIVKLQIKEHLEKLYDALGLDKLYSELPEDFKSYDIAHHLGLNTEQEYAMLQILSESERQETILLHLKQILPIVAETERLKDRVRLNGHFKNLTPPNF
ncbi:LON peptidase substrate-binding domain-containing protein [Pontibacter rugosus]